MTPVEFEPATNDLTEIFGEENVYNRIDWGYHIWSHTHYCTQKTMTGYAILAVNLYNRYSGESAPEKKDRSNENKDMKCYFQVLCEHTSFAILILSTVRVVS